MKRSFLYDLDTTDIWNDRLHQGSAPADVDSVVDAGFDVLVLCAAEHQMSGATSDLLEIIRAPGDDSVEDSDFDRDRQTWLSVSDIVADKIRDGSRVLVTCMGGFNRSGFVNAVVLNSLMGWSGDRCVNHIQKTRDGALCNSAFETWLRENL